MSQLLDELLPLDFEPSIPGLLVIELATTLDKNLMERDFHEACRFMDEQGAYAVAHPEVVR